MAEIQGDKYTHKIALS